MSGPEPDRLLAQLDDQQRVVAESLLGPVCVLAGAGTGKTRAITHRIAYGVATGAYDPSRVMALTFTTRAAGELVGRLRALGADGVSARTFHSAALRQLHYFWPTVVGGSPPRVIDGKGPLIGQAASALKLRLDTAALRDAAAEIEWRKVSRLSLDEYGRAAESRTMPARLPVSAMVDLHRQYEAIKDERRQIDFEDVLLATAGMLEVEPRVAEQVREQYRFFVVDEYQDVSPLQHDLLSLWLGGRRELCVVGDASQTIYSFAGASSDYLVRFGSEFPDARVVRLEDNYRSTDPIVTLANRLMRGRPGALTLRAAARDGAGPSPAPTVAAHPDDASEAAAVAESIARRIADGAEPETIAVLFRINTQSIALEAALRRAGVPVQTRANSRYFDQPEVRQAIMLLRGAAISIGDEPLFKSVSDVLRGLGWRQDPPEGGGAERSRWESLTALLGLAEESPAGTTLAEFVRELQRRAEQQHAPARSAVTLSTLHAAKGLEWDAVYIVGLNEGTVPITFATTLEAVDEERRLFYVGITRARRSLELSWAQRPSASRADRSPSRFLDEVRAPGSPPVGAAGSVSRRGAARR
ncbi:ATP-dependent DNA helicase UvrD2 [Microcella alkalica]|uniref:DNA 3'-5' helicase n=1 Tax=Microcella alkalica TaxID=355930 RepID=A0A839EET1_9MICO|nr:ATP-dependent helicase [Microcella alkalica]MBA8847805.1 DNA helicase-2/ATP-dependent DNA helicase PcrA [Microcella alkalica]